MSQSCSAVVVFWYLSFRRADQFFLRASGGAWIALATTPAPHRYFLIGAAGAAGLRQIVSQSFVVNRLSLVIIRLVLQVSLTTSFTSSVCLPRLLSHLPRLDPGYPRQPSPTTPPPTQIQNRHSQHLPLIHGLRPSPFRLSSIITEGHSNPLPPPAESSSVWILPRLATTTTLNKPFTLYPTQSAIEFEFFDGLCSSRDESVLHW